MSLPDEAGYATPANRRPSGVPHRHDLAYKCPQTASCRHPETPRSPSRRQRSRSRASARRVFEASRTRDLSDLKQDRAKHIRGLTSSREGRLADLLTQSVGSVWLAAVTEAGNNCRAETFHLQTVQNTHYHSRECVEKRIFGAALAYKRRHQYSETPLGHSEASLAERNTVDSLDVR